MTDAGELAARVELPQRRALVGGTHPQRVVLDPADTLPLQQGRNNAKASRSLGRRPVVAGSGLQREEMCVEQPMLDPGTGQVSEAHLTDVRRHRKRELDE